MSCKKENAFDCFTPNGSVISETRHFSDFTHVEVYDNIEVTVLKGNTCKAEVIAGKNIVTNISTQLKGDTLIITNKNVCNFVRGYKKKIKVHVTLPYVTKITHTSVAPLLFEPGFSQDTLLLRVTNSGDVHVNGSFKEVRVSSHGNGDVYISGTSNKLYVYTYGTNFVHAENFIVHDFTFVETLTLGDCIVNASGLNKLVYHIHANAGNIYYKGVPASIENVGNSSVKGKAIQTD